MRAKHVGLVGCLIILVASNSPRLLPAATISLHQYRLGEDDSGSGIGLPGADPTIDSIGSGSINLPKTGGSVYVAGAPIMDTTIGIDFDNAAGPWPTAPTQVYHDDGQVTLTDPSNWGMEAWVNFDSVPTEPNDTEAGIMHIGDFSSGSLTMQLIAGNYYIHAPGIVATDSGVPAAPDIGTWTHVAVVNDGGTAKLYRNGTEIVSAGVGALAPSPGVTIGALFTNGVAGSGAFARGLDGQVDEVRIFEFEAGQFDPLTDLQLNSVFLPPVPLGLEVNTTTGFMNLMNETGRDVDMNAYEILSSGGALDPVGWNSLQEQDLPGFPVGTGSGNGWEEAGGASDFDLTEGYLQGNSTVTDGMSISLGKAFDPSSFGTGVDGDIAFNVRQADGQVVRGSVEYVTGGVELGDVNLDGEVNGLDVDPFVDRLLNGPDQAEADMNQDGDGQRPGRRPVCRRDRRRWCPGSA